MIVPGRTGGLYRMTTEVEGRSGDAGLDTSKQRQGTHWVVRLNWRNRSLFFALEFLALVPYLLEIGASLRMWLLLAANLLLYPQIAYRVAIATRRPLRMELRVLRLDGFLFGIWMAVWGFPLWISVAMALSVSQNQVLFEGWPGLWKSAAAQLAGIALGLALYGAHFRPDTPLLTTLLSMAGLAAYTLMCAHYAYARNVLLRDSRRRLREQLDEITELQAQLEELARRDPLTGTYNRRYLDQALGLAMARAQATGKPLSLLLFDIDHFKRINDSYGHPVGDRVICRMADLLRRRFDGEGQAVCRYGGEEFLVLLPGADAAQAVAMAEDVRAEFIAGGVEDGSRLVRTTVSCGVASWPEHEVRPGELVRLADQALYAAKESGRNRTIAATDAISLS